MDAKRFYVATWLQCIFLALWFQVRCYNVEGASVWEGGLVGFGRGFVGLWQVSRRLVFIKIDELDGINVVPVAGAMLVAVVVVRLGMEFASPSYLLHRFSLGQ